MKYSNTHTLTQPLPTLCASSGAVRGQPIIALHKPFAVFQMGVKDDTRTHVTSEHDGAPHALNPIYGECLYADERTNFVLGKYVCTLNEEDI